MRTDRHTPAAGYLGLLAAVLLAVALQAVSAVRSEVIAKDGAGFIRIARRLAVEPRETLQTEDQHPGYPALVLAASRLLALVPVQDEFLRWITAARLVAGISGGVGMLFLWLLARRLYNPRVADIAALMAAAWPLLRQNAADTLSDTPHLMLYLAAGWMACEGLVRLGAYQPLRGVDWRRPWSCGAARDISTSKSKPRALMAACGWFAGSGAAAGLAYWVRPEGLSACLVGGAVLAGASCWPRRVRIGAALACLSSLMLATFVVAAPYVMVAGKLTSKKDPLQTPAQPAVTGLAAPDISATPGLISEWVPGQPLPGGLPRPDSQPQRFFAAIYELASKLAEAFRYVLLVPLAFGNLAPGRMRRQPAAAVMVYALWLCHAALLMLLYHLAGYISHRHVVPMVALMIPSTAAGMIYMAELARLLSPRVPLLLPRRVLAGLVAVQLLVLGPLGARPSHEVYAPLLDAARWVRDHAQAGDRVLTTSDYVRFYGRIDGLLLGPEVPNLERGLAMAPTDGGWPFLVLEVDRRVFDFQSLTGSGGQYAAVLELPAHPDRPWNSIVVFKPKGASRAAGVAGSNGRLRH